MLAETGTVKVTDLVARFQVTPSTIRRDLAHLQQEGLARRVYGGALTVQGAPPVQPAAQLPTRIGRAAAELIQEGDTVFVGPGHLAEAAARALAHHDRLTIVTNGLAIAQIISEQTDHTLILTGGQLERVDLGLAGELAQSTLGKLRTDWVILELSGVSAADGLADDSLPQAELAQHLIKLGAQVIVLVDPDRVGKAAAGFIGSADEADVVITAREAESAPLWDLTEAGIQLILA